MIQHEQRRLQNWHLKVLEEAEHRGNVAKTCRRYGISREIFYRWRRRYQADGLAGLRARSHAPHHCPRITAPEIVEKVLYLRQHYHMGPWRIGMYLRRYHDIAVGDSTIYLFLKRHGLSRLPHNQAHKPKHQRWRRYEKPLPGHRLQIDTKFLAAIPGKRGSYWQYTAIDDCTKAIAAPGYVCSKSISGTTRKTPLIL